VGSHLSSVPPARLLAETRTEGDSAIGKAPFILIAVVAVWLVGGFYSNATAGGPPTEYSAEQTTQIGKMIVASKIHVQGGKTRIEAQQNEQNTVAISRKDKGLLWMLWPDIRTYIEYSLPQPDSRYEPDPKAVEERVLMGRERINGYETQHFKVVAKSLEGQPIISYVWVAKDLGELVVRRKSDQGQVDIRNVVIGPQSDDLFEIPKGFREIRLQGEGKGQR
jgi:hypothetical protein